MAQGAQVAGEDGVVVLRTAARLPEMGCERIQRRGGHGPAHVRGIGHARVHDAPGGHVGQADPCAAAAQDHRPRPGDGPLGGGGALAAVLQGEAVLPLRRAEMGAGQRAAAPRRTAVQQQRRQAQALRHGGAGPVEPEVGQGAVLHGEGGADALV